MKKLAYAVILAGLLTGVAYSQSLGDVARQSRQAKRKQAAHVYTNDDIPSRVTMKGVPSDDDDAKKSDETAAKDKDPKAEGKSDDSDEALRKKWEDTKTKLSEQRSKIDLLQRELDVLQKENQLQAAQYYADAGSRLRDPKAWTEQQQKNLDGIDTKTKALQDAKDQLEAMQEDGKKTGVPASYLE